MKASVGSIHPLDPFSAVELTAAVAQAKSAWKLDHRHLFAMAQLDEPTKIELASLKPNSPVVRRARMTVWDKSRGVVSEGVLILGGATGALVEIAGAKAPILSSESEQAIDACIYSSCLKTSEARRCWRGARIWWSSDGACV